MTAGNDSSPSDRATGKMWRARYDDWIRRRKALEEARLRKDISEEEYQRRAAEMKERGQPIFEHFQREEEAYARLHPTY